MPTLLPPPRWLGALILGTTLALGGCTISPQPEPPVESAPGVMSHAISIFEIEGGLQVVGGPGAVTGELCELRIYNLDRAGVRLDQPVADDGSFMAEVPGEAGDSLRLQVRSNQGISAPTDITGVGPVEPVTTPLASCLSFQPARELTFGPIPVGELEVQRVRMTNECDHHVSLFGLGVLVGEPSYSFIIPPDPLIPRGSSRVIGVAFSPTTVGEQEEVLVVALENDSERRAVTLRGVGGQP